MQSFWFVVTCIINMMLLSSIARFCIDTSVHSAEEHVVRQYFIYSCPCRKRTTNLHVFVPGCHWATGIDAWNLIAQPSTFVMCVQCYKSPVRISIQSFLVVARCKINLMLLSSSGWFRKDTFARDAEETVVWQYSIYRCPCRKKTTNLHVSVAVAENWKLPAQSCMRQHWSLTITSQEQWDVVAFLGQHAVMRGTWLHSQQHLSCAFNVISLQ